MQNDDIENDLQDDSAQLASLGQRLNLDELDLGQPVHAPDANDSQREPDMLAQLGKPDREHWERDDYETDREWRLFQRYRDSAYPDDDFEHPQERIALKALAAELGVSPGAVYTVSHRRGWWRRASAYDAMIDRALVSTRIETVEALGAAHRRDTSRIREGWHVLVDKWLELVHSGAIEPKTEHVLTVGKWLHESERLAHGQSTQNVSVKVHFTLDQMREELGATLAVPQDRQAFRDSVRALVKTKQENKPAH